SLVVPEGTLEDKLGEVRGIIIYEGAEITGMDYYESQSSKTYSITMRIDPKRFDGFAEKLKGIGTIESMNTDLTDVTEEYANLETRISNLENELERLNALYEKADDIEDMLAIEREITRVTTELENYEQQKTSLEQRAAKSTITVYIMEEKGAVDTNLVIPLQELGNIFFGALSFAIMLIAGVGGFAIPVAITALVVYLIGKSIRDRVKGKKAQVKMKNE
ncbi:DUF4349 domain-containing protein, partial [Candidatus Micrarchaeota archaeon]|nr:DUF4349 domain-containing protein [Candidatus Micrarchaeota archaeon]